MAISLLFFISGGICIESCRWGLLVFLQLNFFSVGTPEAPLFCSNIRLCHEEDPPLRRCVGELFTQAPGEGAPFLLILL